MSGEIHRSNVGTYHQSTCLDRPCEGVWPEITPQGTTQRACDKTFQHCVCYHVAPCNGVTWTINDTRGYVDGGPACDECGACECDDCEDCGKNPHLGHGDGCPLAELEPQECIGLSFAYVCLDGGEALCAECADKEGVTIVPCDCDGKEG